MLDETAPEPDHTALSEARESLRWNGSLWDAILTYHRVADEQAAVKSLEQVTFEGMNAKNGEVSMRFGTSGPDGERVLQAMAEAMSDTLDGCSAENYCEIQAYHREKHKEFLLTVQRLERPTPHDKRMEAEQALTRATEQLAAQSEILARVSELRDKWAEIVVDTEGTGALAQEILERIVNTLDRALSGEEANND